MLHPKSFSKLPPSNAFSFFLKGNDVQNPTTSFSRPASRAGNPATTPTLGSSNSSSSFGPRNNVGAAAVALPSSLAQQSQTDQTTRRDGSNSATSNSNAPSLSATGMLPLNSFSNHSQVGPSSIINISNPAGSSSGDSGESHLRKNQPSNTNMAAGSLPPIDGDASSNNRWNEHLEAEVDSGTEHLKHNEEKNPGQTTDVQQAMNIEHFEQLMTIFEMADSAGNGGLNIDQFREVFGDILGGNLSYDQMTMLFMKIDANSDGTVDWVEFSTYMMLEKQGSLAMEEKTNVCDERIKRCPSSPHRDMIRRVEYIQKERKYITVSRDGFVCLWSPTLRPLKCVSIKDITPTTSWIVDACYLSNQGRLAVITDDRQIAFYDVLAIKPRCVLTINPLENCPMCITYEPNYMDDSDLILFGDDGGFVNVLTFSPRYFIDNAIDGSNHSLMPSQISKREYGHRNFIHLSRRKVHNDWVQKVRYYSEMNTFVTCSTETDHALTLGDIERKTMRQIHVNKGVRSFDYCRRPSFILTGGRDKIIRLFNPFVPSKPAAKLFGHVTGIVQISVNSQEALAFSLSEDKIIKVWDVKTYNCLQTVIEKMALWPENCISTIQFDPIHRQLLIASSRLDALLLQRRVHSALVKSHESPVVCAMFNDNFHQVVSGCQRSTICVWNCSTGAKSFQFNNAHGNLEITAMCFDSTGRRLITGSRDGLIKIWNFNNGQNLAQLINPSSKEITDICYLDMGTNRYILSVGWDRKITIFNDDGGENFESYPIRELGVAETGSRGHRSDVLSICFCPPYILATSSADGEIIIWNLESGNIKCRLSEPHLKEKPEDERAIEKVAFLRNVDENLISSKNLNVPLASCHADGCLRFWNVRDASLLLEVHCETYDNAGLTAMINSHDGDLLIVGDSCGNVSVFNVSKFTIKPEEEDYSRTCIIKKKWRAHVEGITSLGWITTNNMVISSSKDATVRVWTADGLYVGVFGQNQPWKFNDLSSYSTLPMDIIQEKARDKAEVKKLAEKRSHHLKLKENIIHAWKEKDWGMLLSSISGAPERQDMLQPISKKESGDAGSSLTKQSREHQLEQRYGERWKEAAARKREQTLSWNIDPDLLKKSHPTKHFSFDHTASTPRRSSAKPVSFKHERDTSYHTLACHPVMEPPPVSPPKIHDDDDEIINGHSGRLGWVKNIASISNRGGDGIFSMGPFSGSSIPTTTSSLTSGQPVGTTVAMSQNGSISASPLNGSSANYVVNSANSGGGSFNASYTAASGTKSSARLSRLSTSLNQALAASIAKSAAHVDAIPEGLET